MSAQQYISEAFEKIETEKDTAKLFNKTRNLLGWNRSGPPVMLINEGKVVRKQAEIANVQINYYRDKVRKIKDSIPVGDWDPLKLLR